MKRFRVSIPFDKMIEFLNLPKDLEELHITKEVRILLDSIDYRRSWTIMVGEKSEFDELNKVKWEFMPNILMEIIDWDKLEKFLTVDEGKFTTPEGLKTICKMGLKSEHNLPHKIKTNEETREVIFGKGEKIQNRFCRCIKKRGEIMSENTQDRKVFCLAYRPDFANGYWAAIHDADFAENYFWFLKEGTNPYTDRKTYEIWIEASCPLIPMASKTASIDVLNPPQEIIKKSWNVKQERQIKEEVEKAWKLNRQHIIALSPDSILEKNWIVCTDDVNIPEKQASELDNIEAYLQNLFCGYLWRQGNYLKFEGDSNFRYSKANNWRTNLSYKIWHFKGRHFSNYYKKEIFLNEFPADHQEFFNILEKKGFGLIGFYSYEEKPSGKEKLLALFGKAFGNRRIEIIVSSKKLKGLAVDEPAREILVANLKATQSRLAIRLEEYLSRVKETKAIDDIMLAKKNFLLYLFGKSEFISEKTCYFCEQYEIASCSKCPYGKLHGECMELKCDYQDVTNSIKTLVKYIDTNYYQANELRCLPNAIDEDCRKALCLNIKKYGSHLLGNISRHISLIGKAETVEEIMLHKRNLLLAIYSHYPFLAGHNCYYCIRSRKNWDCDSCDYGKSHGFCNESDSQYRKIIDMIKEVQGVLNEKYYKDGKTYV